MPEIDIHIVGVRAESIPETAGLPYQQHTRQDCRPPLVASSERGRHSQQDYKSLAPGFAADLAPAAQARNESFRL